MTDVYPMVERNKIYVVRSGSHSYGLNTPESDVDIRGVFIPDKEYILGNQRIEQYGPTSDDQVYYALAKFIHLATNCNPNIIELLFVEDRDVQFINDFGRKLRENRELFLSKKAKHTFSGYAAAQLKRIQGHYKWIQNPPEQPNRDDFWAKKGFNTRDGEHVVHELFDEAGYRQAVRNWNSYQKWIEERNPKRREIELKYGYDCKHAMHLCRLMNMGIEILTEGAVKVLRPDRDFLKQVREGYFTYDKLIEWSEEREKMMEEAYIRSELPHTPDFDKINNLLIELYEEFLYQK